MGDWFFDLSVPRMALVIFLATYLIAGCVDLVVTRLAVNEKRVKGFKAVSPGMLPVFGTLFALLVGFIAVEVWAISTKQRLQLRPRPAPFVLSFYSPELFQTNRGRAFMHWLTVT